MMASVSAYAAYQEQLKKRKQQSSKPMYSPIKGNVKHSGKNKNVSPKTKDKVKIKIKKQKLRTPSHSDDSNFNKKSKAKKGKRKSHLTNKTLEHLKDPDEEPPLLVPITNQAILPGQNGHPENAVTQLAFLNRVDPVAESLTVFKMLISPQSQDQFLKYYWEKKPLYIDRNNPEYYKHILTTQELDEILRNYPLYFTRNVDVVSYENGVKEVHNSEGRAVPSVLWDFYSNGCSIRILNPQTYNPKVHLILASLQEYFGTMVGANVYLTPPKSQGFAPHFDDIEAFILQLEGQKHWKLYKPVESDVLARDSSGNLSRENLGNPFMEVTLRAGDLLYFPRGTIHEGRTENDHSLHITVSVYQHTAYADLLEHILPHALKLAAQNDVNFRKGLPLNYLKHLGYVNKQKQSQTRREIKSNVKGLLSKLSEYMDLDRAADKLGRKFMHDCMPPVLANEEANCSSRYDGDFMKSGKVYNRIEINLDTNIRLLRYYGVRLVYEEKNQKIYFCTDNAKVYHGEEEQWLELEESHVPMIKKLQELYPQFINVEELPGNDSEKLSLVADLWERGLLVTDRPLTTVDSGSEDSFSS